MGTTATHNLPYPGGTDYVIGGDDAIQALAEATAAALDAQALPVGAILTEDVSGAAVATSSAIISFPGGPELMSGFTWDGATLTRVGVVSRAFLVVAAVNIYPAPGDAGASEVTVHHNGGGTAILTSETQVGARHTITLPIYLGPGNTIHFQAAASGGSDLGRMSLRVLPIGPENFA